MLRKVMAAENLVIRRWKNTSKTIWLVKKFTIIPFDMEQYLILQQEFGDNYFMFSYLHFYILHIYIFTYF